MNISIYNLLFHMIGECDLNKEVITMTRKVYHCAIVENIRKTQYFRAFLSH